MPTNSFVRVPPDSTGKRLFTQEHTVDATAVQAQVMHLADENNPNYMAAVDESGAIYTRFAEGKPQLDSFGKLRVSGATVLGDYTFKEGLLPGLFAGRKVGGGTITHNDTVHCATLALTTASGDITAFTSNVYHHYFPGISQLAVMTVACGDVGKAGLTRRWGYFDSNNGFMFAQVDGVLRAQIRSDRSGTAALIHDVPQSAWNVDKVDGTGPSGMTLSMTDDNIYWIDIQWLGAGRIRFGTYFQGQRVVCHEYYHEGNGGLPHATSGSLPICFAQANTASTASSSEMRAWCCSVLAEASLDITTFGNNKLATFSKAIDVAAWVSSGNEYVYIGSLSPRVTIGNHTNRSVYFPTHLEVLAWDESGNDARAEVKVYVDPALSSASWMHVEPLDPGCTVDKDTAGTLYGGGIHAIAAYMKGDYTRSLVADYKSMTGGSFKNYAESGGTVSGTISAITKASPAVVTFSQPQTPLREFGYPVTIAGVSGMTEINGQTVYAKVVALNQVALYTDSALTTPYNSTAHGTYTSGGTATGLYGDRLVFSIVAKPLTATTGTLNLRVVLSWKEINQ
jgi:hypothetical protein